MVTLSQIFSLRKIKRMNTKLHAFTPAKFSRHTSERVVKSALLVFKILNK